MPTRRRIRFVAGQMAEIESVSARKATLLNPTEEDETVQVIRRRPVRGDRSHPGHRSHGCLPRSLVCPPRRAWRQRCSGRDGGAVSRELPPAPGRDADSDREDSHASQFPSARGMLRLLVRTVARLWQQRPADATAIHLHHIDPAYEPIRQEIVTRLGQSAFVPAITNDVGAGGAGQRALAEEIDEEHHQGLPPYCAYVARTIFMHTLAFNDPLKGLTPEELRFAVTGPTVDLSFVDEARKRFTSESAYLDDRPAAPLRFLAEANLSQIIRREEQHVDPAEARAQLNDRIRQIFGGKRFEAITFPGGPFDVPDEVGDGRPKLVVFAYDGVTIGDAVDEIPDLIGRVHSRKGAAGSALRVLRNHLVFVVADEHFKQAMQRRMRSRLALQRLKGPRPPPGPGGASAGKDPRFGGPLGTGIGDCGPTVLPPRLLPLSGSARRKRRRPRAHGHRYPVRVGSARCRTTADRPGPAGPQEAALSRGRAGLSDLRARPNAVTEGAMDDAGATGRVPAGPDTADASGRRHLYQGHSTRHQAGRLRLPARRSAVRPR